MKYGVLFASLLSISGASAFASEWNNFYSVNVDDAEYFFDAESVIKTKSTVTLWTKSVQKSKPELDGSWSMAVNRRINCPNRTTQLLSWSTYDSAGKFITSDSTAGQEKSVVPDSVGAEILKVACMADFPRNTLVTQKSYFKVVGNDVFAATKQIVELYKSQVDNAPK